MKKIVFGLILGHVLVSYSAYPADPMYRVEVKSYRCDGAYIGAEVKVNGQTQLKRPYQGRDVTDEWDIVNALQGVVLRDREYWDEIDIVVAPNYQGCEVKDIIDRAMGKTNA